MTNGEFIARQGIKFCDLNVSWLSEYSCAIMYCGIQLGLEFDTDHLNSASVIMKWLDEEKYRGYSVLTDSEHEYLSHFIKPFRNDVIDIMKLRSTSEEEYLTIRLNYHSCRTPEIDLPYFKRDRMYRGMRVSKPYTLKELEL